MYFITVAITVGIFIILALSLNLITGTAGQVSLGHAAFLGVGAYTAALIVTKLGLSFWWGLPAATLMAGAVGAFVGLTSIRVREDFLAITTMGVNFVVVAIFLYFPFFGGALGIGRIPSPAIFGWELSKPLFLILVYLLVFLTILLNRYLMNSWLGLAWEGIREDEVACQAIGIDVRRFKVIAFTIGCALAGMAGSLYAHFIGSITAQDFGFPLSITILAMVVFGGLGTIRGAIAGAIILGLAPEILRPLREYRMLMYGGLLLLMMRFQPGGLLGREGLLARKFLGKTF